MWFINKETGLKWEIVDPELINRLSTDKLFEVVIDKPNEPEGTNASKKKPSKKEG